MPTPNPGDLDVTAGTLSCRSGPLPLLIAQLYFQNTFVGGVSTTASACSVLNSLRWRNITYPTAEIHHTLGYCILPSLVKKAPGLCKESGSKNLRKWLWNHDGCYLHIVLTWTAAIIKCACLTDADFTYLLIYNHVYFYLVCIYIYLCLFTSHLSHWNVNLLFRLLVIAVWLTVLLCSVLSWCIEIWQLICSFDFLLFTLWS